MPAFLPENWVRLVASVFLAIVGLTVSVWSIVHMRRRGNGNPMDAFGHEVAPRTRHLMTDGPYRLSRNPMLTGTFVYLIGVCVWLWTWQAFVVFALFVAIMLVQVRTEEARLRRDFGNEYEAYCRRTGRFLPF
ncbi:MAG: isoprenylcysteine carboxylmethyltransferase family protein [Paludibacteraceae bacterium]|nr:isoprenylcysteine carboxylmethyltransferase family protein [Paludibacteraceae bacterium]